MAIKIELSQSEVVDMAVKYDRLENFGYKGWNHIAEYLENLSDDMGTDIELDIIAICCEYNHADSVESWAGEYLQSSDIDADEWQEADDDEKLELIENYLQENTSMVCCEHDCIIWQAF